MNSHDCVSLTPTIPALLKTAVMRENDGLVVLALISFAMIASAAPGGVSRLEGTVRDASGALVPHASILCVGETTGFRFIADTGLDGHYVLSVPQGRYNIVVRRAGFRLVARMAVQARPEASVRVDFEIAPESISESVTILGAAVQTRERETRGHAQQNTEPGVLRPDELRSIPHNDATVTGLLTLAPGVLVTPASRGESGQFSSSGARPNTNRFTVDGVSANNAVAGAGWPSFLPGDRLPAMTALGTTQTLALLDSVQDVTVESEDGAASLEQDPGAHVLIHTKPGADHFHGSLSYAGRPPALGATDWFANRFGLGSDAPSLNSVSGSFGGPLQRDRTFLFVAAERLEPATRLRVDHDGTFAAGTDLFRKSAAAVKRVPFAERAGPQELWDLRIHRSKPDARLA